MSDTEELVQMALRHRDLLKYSSQEISDATLIVGSAANRLSMAMVTISMLIEEIGKLREELAQHDTLNHQNSNDLLTRFAGIDRGE